MPVLQNILFYIIPFILVVGVVVTIHELGHFLAARALGTKVERFSIGFGRTIASWRDRGGVEWRIGWMPIGGYVRFAGDENAASIPDQDDLIGMRQRLIEQGRGAEIHSYFHFKPLWQRAIIIAAGPLANFLLAIAIFTTLLMAFGEQIGSLKVWRILPNSPAAEAGFRPGDVIQSVDGVALESFDQFKQRVILSSDTPLTVVVRREGRDVTLVATPRRGDVMDQLGHKQRLGQLGLLPDQTLHLKTYSFPAALQGGVTRTWDTVTTTVTYVGRIFSGKETADQLSGPLGMAQLSGDVAKQTRQMSPTLGAFFFNLTVELISLAGSISVGIGFINLLPVPVLDGGHLLFYAYEAVTRRPLAAKVQAAGYRVGLALVLGLMLFATWNDLQRLRVFHLFGGLFS
jgi:regulator of sigma E protease